LVEFFPDDDEEEAEGAAPAVDASGQYAFQSDGMSPLHQHLK
jgi:importin subunit alpha-1